LVDHKWFIHICEKTKWLVNKKKKNSKHQKKIPNFKKSMLNPYFGIWIGLGFYQKPDSTWLKSQVKTRPWIWFRF
jgi:hypothetical protein